MKAIDIIERLSNDIGWIHRITQQFEFSRDWPYDTTDFRLFPEVTVRIPAGRKLQRRRMDAVAVIRVSDMRYRPILVGIEVKVNTEDLIRDVKITEYLPYVDSFYIAVPYDMGHEAIAKTETDYRLSGVGVLRVGRCVETKKQGAIYRPSDKNCGELCQELLMKAVFRQKWEEADQAV